MSFTRTLRAVGGAVTAGVLLFAAAPTALADQNRDDQWPLKAFDAQSVWKQSTGKGVTVAVIDDPVNGDHPDLKGSVLPGKSFVDGGRGDQKGMRDHGTGMASLIAGHGHGPGSSDGVMGLAPDAKILPVAVPADGEDASGSSVGSWVRYAVDQGASVINMSINPYYIGEDDKSALAYALQKNVLVVVGAGNDGQSKLSELASTPGVVSVGAVDKTGKVWSKSNSGSQLMLSAPGVEITSASATAGQYRLADGTSDATAYVSATAALLRSKFPDLTAGQIANRLVKSAGLPPGEKGLKLPDPHYGYGFVQPLKALTADIPAGSKNGPLKTPKTDPATGTSGANAAGASGNGKEQGDQGSGLGMGAIVGIAVGVLVVAGIIVIVIVRQKKNGRHGPPPGGFGGPGGAGLPPQPSGPYQQQGAYQQPGPYHQQPGGSAGFPPPAPPTQPPGQ
ncbi:S8 family serine peptidase [Streptomyces sp. N2A]|uniref:S8 family serine peptidase n=1 Tax=Streptomyces sp. N2A TaxID=3073936 RepID=UPI002870A344|nr:S8 family serine peptidase [Streptomyces sp. N2A]